jgi:hypothetical protein
VAVGQARELEHDAGAEAGALRAFRDHDLVQREIAARQELHVERLQVLTDALPQVGHPRLNVRRRELLDRLVVLNDPRERGIKDHVVARAGAAGAAVAIEVDDARQAGAREPLGREPGKVAAVLAEPIAGRRVARVLLEALEELAAGRVLRRAFLRVQQIRVLPEPRRELRGVTGPHVVQAFVQRVAHRVAFAQQHLDVGLIKERGRLGQRRHGQWRPGDAELLQRRLHAGRLAGQRLVVVEVVRGVGDLDGVDAARARRHRVRQAAGVELVERGERLPEPRDVLLEEVRLRVRRADRAPAAREIVSELLGRAAADLRFALLDAIEKIGARPFDRVAERRVLDAVHEADADPIRQRVVLIGRERGEHRHRVVAQRHPVVLGDGALAREVEAPAVGLAALAAADRVQAELLEGLRARRAVVDGLEVLLKGRVVGHAAGDVRAAFRLLHQARDELVGGDPFRLRARRQPRQAGVHHCLRHAGVALAGAALEVEALGLLHQRVVGRGLEQRLLFALARRDLRRQRERRLELGRRDLLVAHVLRARQPRLHLAARQRVLGQAITIRRRRLDVVEQRLVPLLDVERGIRRRAVGVHLDRVAEAERVAIAVEEIDTRRAGLIDRRAQRLEVAGGHLLAPGRRETRRRQVGVVAGVAVLGDAQRALRQVVVRVAGGEQPADGVEHLAGGAARLAGRLAAALVDGRRAEDVAVDLGDGLRRRDVGGAAERVAGAGAVGRVDEMPAAIDVRERLELVADALELAPHAGHAEARLGRL